MPRGQSWWTRSAMRRIPKKVQLLGHTIRVSVVSKRVWDELCEDYDMDDAVGFWRIEDHAIVLLRQPKSKLLHTFMHELTHAILDMMDDKLSANEKWVDRFSGLLAQAMDTAE